MTSFETTWQAVEDLELDDPLKELGSFLRSQPGTGIDKPVFSDSPSAMQKARLFNALKDADPDLSDVKTVATPATQLPSFSFTTRPPIGGGSCVLESWLIGHGDGKADLDREWLGGMFVSVGVE